MGMGKGVAISNIHPRIRLRDIVEMFGVFDKVVGFRPYKDGFVLKFESFPEKSLAMDNFPLARRRMKVNMIDWNDGYDTFEKGNIVVFESCFDVDEIRDECCMFGCVTEVLRRDGSIYVICNSTEDGENIFMNMYGRYYNKERIRCRMANEKTPLMNE
ncbi:hypothetical protein EHEL_040080 [Encephalitozoon hellem ATCC 50504]|uniref:RRM domain-containing protein n=1 Tax=Encephalitozoon hellem TaxID=27973 RepID=A0A9Q9CBQ9_ENCHE|nr:uncharacterized protein EHEL_040080 [Encephalitozoon hellem ATCC 50504]AFM98062.1 hypothetical protein EHEL_040080 [Encephalitozoon hellem ATCC 50504]UTX42903.1 hypothetical protein GPU96_04g06310 [Encephalitozoon hellem]WEL38360.1 RRM domain-containing protein [Encephalitozoon hellem]|eukprot:XP_003887043.1 hypothetical protein EHEL_040080 [Encephalitozoon hellem ATCC 50504]